MVIDGKKIAAGIRSEIAAQAATFARKHRAPCLSVVLCGDNPASVSYVTAKERACAECGFVSHPVRFPSTVTRETLLAEIEKLNAAADIDGILVQLPLPGGIDEQEVIRAISPEKDVDGFHPVSLGRLVLGLPGFVPCTPAGIVELLIRSGVETRGRHAVVVGRSNIVGKPVAALLSRKGQGGDATVTLCHTATENLGAYTKSADILVVAAGHPGTVRGDMVKKGAVVIDVGVNRIADQSKKAGYRLVGDVVFDEVEPVSSMITPVPGGVGPMTIAMLMKNTLLAAIARTDK